jgi:hypothetical protein
VDHWDSYIPARFHPLKQVGTKEGLHTEKLFA